MDMGICVEAGASRWPQCTLSHAPPEIVAAAWENRFVTVHPSHDVWALGVIAYEAVTGTRAVQSTSAAVACAQGGAPYPWEAPPEAQNQAWRQSRVRAIVEPCLSRYASVRPHATQIHKAVNRMGQRTTVS